MPQTNYISELNGAQIEAALEAVHGVVSPSNNGKVLCIEDGKIAAKSAAELAGDVVLEPVTFTGNGTFTPPAGVDGFDSVTVDVSGGGGSAVVQPLDATQNGTYNPPSGVDGFSPVTVNVSGGGGKILYGTAAPASSDGDNGDTYVQYQNVGGIDVVVKVTGGYNGGAVIDISFDGTSVFTATASDTYNRSYDTTHADVDVSGETITIDVTPPPSNTGKLTIAVASGQDSKTLEISAAGQNTSYGYGNYSESFQLLTSGSGIRQATAILPSLLSP